MKSLIVDDDASSIKLLRGFLLPYGECVSMVSAASVKENLIKAFKGQCDAFLPKPVGKNDVLRQLYLLDLGDANAIVKDLLNI